MPVADLARAMARRYVDTMPIADWAQAPLEPLGVPKAARTPAYVDELVIVWRRILEAALVEHYTIPELGALARFHSTPEGAAICSTSSRGQTARGEARAGAAAKI